MIPFHQQPHHDGSELYALTLGEGIGAHHRVRVRVPAGFEPIASIFVRVVVDGEPVFTPLEPTGFSPDWDADARWWQGAFALQTPVSRYRFLINAERGAAWWLSADGLDAIEPRDASDFQVTIHPRPARWAAAQVIYQVFPDRFARSADAAQRPAPEWAQPATWTDPVIAEGEQTPRQFFGGDLDGITEHLDHLERLGVTLVYLTPFFPARSNHRYDASTFEHVDPLLGGDEALIRLVQAAHRRGIRVIGDLTTNHTGDAHDWFAAARSDADAVEAEFYYWTNPERTGYVGWCGVSSLPKLNWNSRELRRRFTDGPDSVVGKWLRPPYDLDGWRIDVANMTGRLGTDDLNRDVQRAVRKTMDEIRPGLVLYGESTNDALGDFDGDGWDAPMSYIAFTRPLWHWLRTPPSASRDFNIPYAHTPVYTARDMVQSYRRFTGPFPWPVRLMAMTAIDTHDTARFAEHAGDAEQLVAAGLSMALPGTPVVFAGDEFALRGRNGEESRQPLPWHEEPRLADAYGALARQRTSSPALQHGGVRWIHADDECMLFARELDDEAVLVFAGRNATSIALPVSAVGVQGDAAVSFGGIEYRRTGDALHVSTTGPAFAIWPLRATTGAATPPVLGDLVEAAR